ncbi:GCD6 (YDR211W) [Zygosaccharomyces parabailii]|uniref:Translation initiation factor eIF2B subunit epsilon n=1 Tax=Zygosaccharomyces bailii (strain CLIB 213 / ATCC 58445 / CBS 680 / BCRC 21525 / NBRC 1098 / NCYC 1416 / NRRL Y-2227) TaxID=1333698 RepID=A0A8J2T5U8_ZYGB2|nr:GCD6 (YDR211W) [Zygosaccharomyces parabailii]CDF87763.1 BN860_13938g1_1 [Zygosaccharomyces bailii CLIB 213]CDH17822.1 probable GCD6-Translation initiation factor eIF2b epsilon, 81 kDa subunit [Zygosaccharomyces bailii ISA1307]
MAGKKTKSHPKAEMGQDDRLQAIVLTDSFETRFMPLSYDKPRCLLPLANVPLIEYTLEFLAKGSVKEVYVVCSSHASQISSYIETSKWNFPWSPFKIFTIMSPEARSVGDAMRDLDNKGVITGDFLLVSGDAVTNLEFDKMWDFHKRVHAKDKDHIVTTCLSKATQYHKTRAFEPATFILDKSDNRCLYYQEIPLASSKEKSAVEIDPDLLEGVDEFVLRNDLIDCRIDICSPQVPAIFQENFDYQMLRSDFVKGVLSSDLLRKHVYAYITDEYAARVESWQSYDSISQDFIGRWCYPLVLDSNLMSDQTYSYESGHIYKEKDVVLAQSCKIGKCTAIGSRTKIGGGSVVENCVIGRNCHIGAGCTIRDSYIWDNTIIGNESVINHSIIADKAKLGNNVMLNDGCIIGFNVVIEDSKRLEKGVRVSGTPIKSMDDSALGLSDSEDINEEPQEYAEIAIEICGAKGSGYLYEDPLSEDDHEGPTNEKMISGLSHRLEEACLSDASISSVPKSKKKRTLSTNSVYTDREENPSELEEDEEDFEFEGVATVKRAIENNHDLDTALLELNTLRMSLNVSYHEVRKVTVIALLDRVYHFIATQTLGPKDATVKVFSQWGQLFRRQAFDHEEHVDLMNVIMEEVVEQNFEKPDLILFSAFTTLYDTGILEEEAIYDWWTHVSKDPKFDNVKRFVAKWVEWLQEADEESSSDESEGEEEDQEEDE